MHWSVNYPDISKWFHFNPQKRTLCHHGIKFKLVILCPTRGQCHVPLLFVALTDSNPKLVACPVILYTWLDGLPRFTSWWCRYLMIGLIIFNHDHHTFKVLSFEHSEIPVFVWARWSNRNMWRSRGRFTRLYLAVNSVKIDHKDIQTMCSGKCWFNSWNTHFKDRKQA